MPHPPDNGHSANQRMWRDHPFVQLTLVRIREFLRQPEAVFWVYGFPILMMTALGIAFRSQPVESFNVRVIEGDQAEEIASTLEADERFNVQRCTEREARNQLRAGKADLLIAASEETPLRHDYFFDPTKPGSLLARDSARDRLERAAGRQDLIETSDHELEEPGGRYIDFLVPGLLGMGLMGGGMWGVGFVIVDLRIRKLMKRYLATPMKKQHFLASLMISRIVFTVPECLILLGFAWLAFGVVNHGNYAAVTVLIMVGAFQFAGVGLLVACRARTLEAISGLMNLVMLPMWIASGVFYSVERFPDAIEPYLRILPLTPLIDALRAVMQEGASLLSLGPELGICIAWTVIPFVLALRWFRWN